MIFAVVCRNCEEECRAFVGFRFRPNSSAVTFNDLFADGQPHSGARIFLACVEPLEQNKDSLEVFWVNTDAVVFNLEDPLTIFPTRADVDLRRRLTVEFDRV